jgi:transposase InsO family protein
MTELPDDMEAHLEAVARSLGDGDFTRVTFPEGVAKKTARDLRALLLAYQEQRRALERVTDLLASANRSTDRPSDYVSRAVMEARAALNQKGDER